jgi:isoleucyl-tRNA synthetase
MDKLYRDLNSVANKTAEESVHLALFPSYDRKLIDSALEERMEIAQKISSMVLALRRKVSIKVRQPLAKIMIPIPDNSFKAKFEAVKNLVLAEVNVKDVEYIDDSSSLVVKKAKPNFKTLGPRYGKLMKEIGSAIAALSRADIAAFEANGSLVLKVAGKEITIAEGDVEIISEDIPGWQVANEGKLTVALDVTVTDELRYEGIAREFVNRIQNIRKENGYDVTDRIIVKIEKSDLIAQTVKLHAGYIGQQTLANKVSVVDALGNGASVREVDIDEIIVKIAVDRA